MFENKDSLINEQMLPHDFENQQKAKMPRKKKLIIAGVCLFMALILSLGIYILTLFSVKKSYAYVKTYLDLPDPVQFETSGEIVKQVGEYEVTYELKAAYTIMGLVVEKYYYFPNKIENKISRFDLGIAWGPLLGVDLSKYMSFKNDGNRFLQYKYSNELTQLLGGKKAVIDSLSNNHMIHADETVLKCLRNVKEGDYIKVEGFLVYATMRKANYVGHWDSSLSRTDHGDGACEVMYVTNITWLKMQ